MTTPRAFAVDVYANYWPNGTGTNFILSRILKPFEAMRERMIAFRDLKLPWEGSEGGGHERRTAIMLTGVRTTELYPGNGGDDPIAFGPSVDQIFLKQCDDLKHTQEFLTRFEVWYAERLAAYLQSGCSELARRSRQEDLAIEAVEVLVRHDLEALGVTLSTNAPGPS